MIMYPTLFSIIEGEKVLSSDFSTHLVPLQKHSLVLGHFTHSGTQYLCEGCRRTERGGRRGGSRGRGERGDEEKEKEGEKGRGGVGGEGGRRGGGRQRERRGEDKVGKEKKSRSFHIKNLLLYTYNGTQYIFML